MKNNIYEDKDKYAISVRGYNNNNSNNKYAISTANYNNKERHNKNNYNEQYEGAANYSNIMPYNYYNSYDRNPYITDNDYFNQNYDYINYEYAYDDGMSYDGLYLKDDFYKQNKQNSSYESGKQHYQDNYKNNYDDIELRQLSVSLNQEYGLGGFKGYSSGINPYFDNFNQSDRLKENSGASKPAYDGGVYQKDYGYSRKKNHKDVGGKVSGDTIQFEDMFIINSQYFEEDEDEKLISLRDILNLFVFMILSITLAFLVVEYVVQHTDVDGVSMEFNYHDKDTLIIDKLSYKLSEPKRFDVITFRYQGQTYFIKRIIGLPGDKVLVTDKNEPNVKNSSKIFINDKELKEDYGFAIKLSSGTEKEITVGEDEYFVMGDNRNYSKDSRNAQVGLVKKNVIRGKVLFRVYPFERMGTIDNFVNKKIKQGDKSLAVDGDRTIEDFPDEQR